MISILALKIISTIALFIMSVGGGIAPYFFKNLKESNRYLSWSNAFSGGIFFGAGLLHLFADATEDMQEYIEKHLAVLPFLLVIALSIHSLFEGLAMGIQTTELHVIDILIAIFAHKILAAFALGVSIVSVTNSKTSFIKLLTLILVFSFASPIGAIIGMVIVGVGNVADSLVPAILQGISSGTFLYVAVVEDGVQWDW
eukprot:gene11566-14168_t